MKLEVAVSSWEEKRGLNHITDVLLYITLCV